MPGTLNPRNPGRKGRRHEAPRGPDSAGPSVALGTRVVLRVLLEPALFICVLYLRRDLLHTPPDAVYSSVNKDLKLHPGLSVSCPSLQTQTWHCGTGVFVGMRQNDSS